MLNAIYIYRISHWLYVHHIPLLPKIFQLLIFLVYNCSIPYKCQIGKGSFFNHGGIGVLFNSGVVIGEDCKIGNNASIVGQGPYSHVPRLGNKVYVGPGAVIQGPVIVEDYVIIAPNAVVTQSVPAYMIVAGVPARIIGDSRKLNYDIFKNESFDEGIKEYMKPCVKEV